MSVTKTVHAYLMGPACLFKYKKHEIFHIASVLYMYHRFNGNLLRLTLKASWDFLWDLHWKLDLVWFPWKLSECPWLKLCAVPL